MTFLFWLSMYCIVGMFFASVCNDSHRRQTAQEFTVGQVVFVTLIWPIGVLYVFFGAVRIAVSKDKVSS